MRFGLEPGSGAVSQLRREEEQSPTSRNSDSSCLMAWLHVQSQHATRCSDCALRNAFGRPQLLQRVACDNCTRNCDFTKDMVAGKRASHTLCQTLTRSLSIDSVFCSDFYDRLATTLRQIRGQCDDQWMKDGDCRQSLFSEIPRLYGFLLKIPEQLSHYRSTRVVWCVRGTTCCAVFVTD